MTDFRCVASTVETQMHRHDQRENAAFEVNSHPHAWYVSGKPTTANTPGLNNFMNHHIPYVLFEIPPPPPPVHK